MVTMLDNKILCFLAFISIINGIFSEYNLTIVHIGDFHSHWFEFNEKEGKCSDQESVMGKCFGGFPRLLNLVRDIRSKEKNVVVLSSGEFFLGQSLNPLHGFKIANSLLPRLELDAMSLANHDFGSGILDLSAFLYAMNFPVVCANMLARETSYLYSRVNKSAIIDVNGERIGVVGYVHPDTLQKSKKAVSVKFTSEIPAIQDEVDNLERKGINKIIALGHSSYYTDLEIAKNVKGVDVVIGGNSDIVLENTKDENGKGIAEGNIHGNYPRVHHHNDTGEVLLSNKTLVLHIPQHGKYVGLLRLTFDDEGRVIHESGEPVLLDSSIPQDMDTLYFLQKVSLTLEDINRHSRLPDYDEVLTTARQDLESGKCRMAECALGNLVTDAMMDTYSTKNQDREQSEQESEKWGPVDAVVFNSGSIRYPLQKGKVTIRELIHSFYVGDVMKRVSMSGRQLRQMMEHSVDEFDPTRVTAPGTFLQVSGLRVIYDLSKSPGKRVRTLSVRCEKCNRRFTEVKASKNYFVAMPEFIALGGDGYPVHEMDNSNDFGHPEILLILEYLTKINEVLPVLDGRISFLSAYQPSNLTKENQSDTSNTAKLQIPLSTTTSKSSKDTFLSESHLDTENKYSYMGLKQGHIPKEVSSAVSIKEEPESLKLSFTQGSPNSPTSMPENIKHDFAKSSTGPFWFDFILKPKHKIVARKSVEELGIPLENETLKVNNNFTKSTLGTVEDYYNISHHVAPTTKTVAQGTLKNANSQYEFYNFKIKDKDSSVNNSKHRTERVVPANSKNFLPKIKIVYYNSSFEVENNMETNLSQTELSLFDKLHDSPGDTTFVSMNTKYENNSSAGKGQDIENINPSKDSVVNYNTDFEFRNDNSNIFESIMLDEIRNEAEPTYLLDDKLEMIERNSNSILNNTSNGGPKFMRSFDVTANALDVNSDSIPSEEAMISVPFILTLRNLITNSEGLSGMQDVSTDIAVTEDVLSVKAKENYNKTVAESIPHFLNVGSSETKIQISDELSGDQVGDGSNISKTCDTCPMSVDEGNKTSLDRRNDTTRKKGAFLTKNSSTVSEILTNLTEGNFKYSNEGLLTYHKDTAENVSVASNLAEENVRSANGISSNFVGDANQNIEIANSLLVDSIANTVLKRIQNNTIYSNFKDHDDPDATKVESSSQIDNWTTGLVNKIRFNILKVIGKDIEIEKDSLVDSIANSIFESMKMDSAVSNTSNNSNFTEESLKKVTVAEQTLNDTILNITHKFEDPRQFRKLTNEIVKNDTINVHSIGDANLNIKVKPSLSTSPSSNSFVNKDGDTTKVPQGLTSTLTNDNAANNNGFNNSLTLYADIQDDQNDTGVEGEISWFPWFF